MTFDDLHNFDLQYTTIYPVVGGIDEAGRGPLAGPVVAACVILKPDAHVEGLNDSKKLTEKKRKLLFPLILQCSETYGIGVASPEEIDDVNILNATYLAMRRAANNAGIDSADYLLIDGNRIPPDMPCECACIIKGDGCSASIAAASVLAKVTRDRLMYEYSVQYPQYLFDKHKGYPTKAHYEKIKEFGISEIHRKSFLKNLSEK